MILFFLLIRFFAVLERMTNKIGLLLWNSIVLNNQSSMLILSKPFFVLQRGYKVGTLVLEVSFKLSDDCTALFKCNFENIVSIINLNH